MKTKEVGYSYPHSPNSYRGNMSETGCYTVSLTDESGPVAYRHFATIKEAFDFADTLPEAYNQWSLKP